MGGVRRRQERWFCASIFDAGAWKNKCLQRAVVALCGGRVRLAAEIVFAELCANDSGSSLCGTFEEALNFLVVETFLREGGLSVVVSDVSGDTLRSRWTLGRQGGKCLGELRWNCNTRHVTTGCDQIW